MKEYQEYVDLLKNLIATPSLSREESETAHIIQQFLAAKKLTFQAIGNNIVVGPQKIDRNKPNLLLNSHHDTVKPGVSWTRDPYKPVVEEGKLYGLGGNDAGAALVSLLAAFIYFYPKDVPFNLYWIASAEEEISGSNGISLALSELGVPFDLAIVGEPTNMNLAIAEKGLMVLDCYAHGRTGHAARNEGENAIYLAMEDIDWFRNYQFADVSNSLGPVKMTVTMINSGTQHNVIPDLCHFVVDVRSTDKYTNEELLEIISNNVKSEVKARSTRLQPSGISTGHPLVKVGIDLGMKCFGSPTLSDQALMPFTSVKIGPGDSSRSHSSNEYVFLEEIISGIDTYIKLLEKYFDSINNGAE